MIYIGSDHAGFDLKLHILKYFEKCGHSFLDVGCFNNNPCDYPDVAKEVCLKLVRDDDKSRAVLVCGTGVGMAIVANKFKKIRAVVGLDYFSTQLARRHNDANVLCLGGRVLAPQLAFKLVDLFLNTSFERGRHTRRLEKMYNI